MESEVLLEVAKLSKSFGGLAAINGVSFRVLENEVSSFIGPNGAGKSTLFNLVTGYITEDSGSVRFRGEDITNKSAPEICKKGIGRSFQQVNLFGGLTVLENIQISILCGMGKGLRFLRPYRRMVKEEAYEVLKKVNLEDKAADLGYELSYGDQKRLEIAIAICNKPRLLLLDEPTAGISKKETTEIVQLIQEISKSEKTATVLVEHDMDVVFGISEKIRVLYQGRILTEGTPDEVKENKEVQKIYLGEKEG